MRFLEFNPRREKKKKKRGLIFIFVGLEGLKVERKRTNK